MSARSSRSGRGASSAVFLARRSLQSAHHSLAVEVARVVQRSAALRVLHQRVGVVLHLDGGKEKEKKKKKTDTNQQEAAMSEAKWQMAVE